jgi:hypothetical protein
MIKSINIKLDNGIEYTYKFKNNIINIRLINDYDQAVITYSLDYNDININKNYLKDYII